MWVGRAVVVAHALGGHSNKDSRAAQPGFKSLRARKFRRALACRFSEPPNWRLRRPAISERAQWGRSGDLARRLLRGGIGGDSAFAHLEAHEAPDGDVLAQLGDHLADQLADGHRLVLDEVLLVEAVFLVELFHLAVDDFLDHRFRLAGGARLLFVDFALVVENLRGHLFAPHIARIQRGDVHGHVVAQPLKILGARHEIGFAVDLHQHADFPARVNVVAHQTFARLARRLLLRRRLALVAQDVDRPLDVRLWLRPAPRGNRENPAPVRSRSSFTSCAEMLTGSDGFVMALSIPFSAQ